jgi:predicted Ser/Thr protein kinase/tetratricopeptide (TPR) repeat protein
MDESNRCQYCGKPVGPKAVGELCPECLMKVGLGSGVEPETGQPKTRPAPPAPEEIAKHFTQLEILSLLGQGGMGFVYKAHQKDLERIVALKILPPSVGDDPAFAQRFAGEAKALAKLNHPGIVTIYEFGKTNGLFYFLMEFVDGVNLRQLLANGRISSREALAIVPQICDALQYAHDQGIVHRDIKPENILLDRKGRVKVADFGLAKLIAMGAESSGAGPNVEASTSLTEAGKVMGTPQYMAPEQKERPTEVDHRADIYSLGVVFYQMLTGELPGKRIEPPSKKVVLDVRLDEVVLRALEKQPELRYQQASVLKTDVETIAGSAAPIPQTTKCAGETESKPESKEGERGSSAPVPAEEVRFSRPAIAGALWIPVCFVIFLMARLAVGLLHRSNIPSPPIALGIIILALGPVGMTILGWLAVGQIRRSAGKLRGLGLAVFDGLLFPLLALDFVIAGIASSLLPNFRSEHLQWLEVAIVVGWVGLALAVDAWISWKVWRAVNTNVLPIQKPDRFWRRFAIAIACVPLILIAIVIGYLFLSREGSSFVREQKSATLVSPDPKDARIHLDLAKSLAQVGERDRAIAELQWALQLDPTNEEARNLLKALETNAKSSKASPSVQSRTFTLRHTLASDMADQLVSVLQSKPGTEAKVSKGKLSLTVTAPPDVLTRVATFIAVQDQPEKISRGSYLKYQQESVETYARAFFYACSIEDVPEAISQMLSLPVLAELKGVKLPERGRAFDTKLVNELRGNWEGRDAAVRKVVNAWNKYPLDHLRERGLPVRSRFGEVYFASVSFEGAPEDPVELSFIHDGDGSVTNDVVLDTLPPWFERK